MSFPQYGSYRDSGVQWFGKLPSHWTVEPVKRLCDVRPSNVDKKTYDGEQRVRLCNYTDVYYREQIVAGLDLMEATASAAQLERFSLRSGDVVITKDSETADDIAIAAHVPEDLPGVVCGYHLALLRPHAGTHGAFVKRFFDSQPAKAQAAIRANGLTRVGLSQYALDNLLVPTPPAHEQAAIAKFLDTETAKIDTLVEEKRHLIALLKEKRQALISHAVTRGLDPHAPMKDSGIEWLGQIPASWTTTNLGRAAFMQEGPGLRHWQFTDDGVRVICVTNITEQGIDFDRLEKFISEEEYLSSYTHFTVNQGDVLLSSSGNSWGKVATYRKTDPVILNTSTIRLAENLDQDLVGEYIAFLLQSDVVREQLDLAMTGACQPNFGPTHLSRVTVAIPPREAQEEILKVKDRELTRVDDLIAEAAKGIQLLQERRAALISAAVTGKFDVSELAKADNHAEAA